ncbi:MAG: prenyltransferase/squalene oxidase repeat-containing protein [Sulfuricaulis sp.]
MWGNRPSWHPGCAEFPVQGGQNNVRYLARLVMINAKAGVDTTALVNTLMSYQNLDGGFGFQVGYQSSVLDTAYALEGLARANYISNPQTAVAVGYLLSQQQASGGWAAGDNDPWPPGDRRSSLNLTMIWGGISVEAKLYCCSSIPPQALIWAMHAIPRTDF